MFPYDMYVYIFSYPKDDVQFIPFGSKGQKSSHRPRTDQDQLPRSPVWWKNIKLGNISGQPVGLKAQHALMKPLGCNVNKANLVSHYMTIYRHKGSPSLHIPKPMFSVRPLNPIPFNL